jgi:hypothetical protein
MKNLSRIGCVAVLTLFLTVSTLAGEMPTPPGEPGATPSPPAPSSGTPGQTETPSLSDSVDLYALAEIALERLLLF